MTPLRWPRARRSVIFAARALGLIGLTVACSVRLPATPARQASLATPVVADSSVDTVGTGATAGMVRVSGGPFLLGGGSLYAPSPAVRVDLAPFLIDRTPVTNADFARFTRRSGYTTVAELAGDPQTWRSAATPGKDDYPVVFVTWTDAAAYCASLDHERLPDEREWEKAARGTDGRLWPWGDAWDPTLANSLEGGRGGTAPVGSYRRGVSPYGALDMAGNVWQWTASSSDELPSNPITGAATAGQKVLRGGSWRTIANGTQSSYRKFAPPDYRRDSVGFRCASNVTGEDA